MSKEIKDKYDSLKPGQVVKVHQKIKEFNTKGEEKERIQIFEGVILAKRGDSPANSTITVRKVSNGIGVERIFPLQLPTINQIEVVKQIKVRRAKLYYMKNYGKKVKEVAPKAA